MDTVLTGAVVLSGMLLCLNVRLTRGVIRRMREHDRRHATASAEQSLGESGFAVDRSLPVFATTAIAPGASGARVVLHRSPIDRLWPDERHAASSDATAAAASGAGSLT